MKRTLSDDDVVRIAEAAGLHKALAEYREDVIAAAKSAMDARNAFTETDDPALEPCPAMRARGAA